MKNLILKVLKKIFHLQINKIVKVIEDNRGNSYSVNVKRYIDSGNIRIGNNCRIDGDLIYPAYALKNGYINLEIGDNCHLMGLIDLYSSTAKVTIGSGVFIGPKSILFCRKAITIGNDVMISWGCTLIDTNAHSLNSSERKSDVIDWKKGAEYKNWDVAETKPIHIKDKSWIGFNSIIAKGVILGEGTILASGSVLSKSTESYTILGGNPAVFIKNTE